MKKKEYGINYFKDFADPFTRKEKMKRALWTFVWHLLISWNHFKCCKDYSWKKLCNFGTCVPLYGKS